MTIEGRNTYWLHFERRRNSVERRWKSKVRQALNNQVAAMASEVKWKGIDAARQNINEVVRFEGVGIIIKDLYRQAGVHQATITAREARRLKFSGMGVNEKWAQAIEEYFKLHLLNRAVLPITETTKKIILDVLTQAVDQGWGVDQTVRELLKQCDEINRKRAQVIVRTESVRAMNVGSIIGAHESSIVLDKVWITARDERVRSSHRRLDNITLDMEDTFPNGCAFPGDPNGSARETINCRCTLAFVPKRDEQGRPIRKPAVLPMMNDRRQVVGQVAEGIAAGIALGTLIGELTSQ